MKTATLTVVLVLLQFLLCVLGQLLAPLRFDEGSYSGTEGMSTRVCLSIARLAEFPQVECVVRVTVMASTSAGSNSATLGDDFTLNDGLDSVNVTFTSRNAQSICFDIVLENDGIVEGNEVFMLSMLADSLVVSGSNCESVFIFDTMASATVTISDNPGNVVHCKFNSRNRTVEEGKDDSVSLTASCRGRYQRTITIAVRCDPTRAVGVRPANNPDDFSLAMDEEIFQFEFNDGDQTTSTSNNTLTIFITDDNCAEPTESFICTLQSGSTQSVQSEDPEQVTIDIEDDDELIIHWERNFYKFTEEGPAKVELVTDSCIADNFTVFGEPVEISNGIVTQEYQIAIGSILLQVPYRTVNFEGMTYGIATVSPPNATDVTETNNAFLFTNASRSATSIFTHVDDNICEGDELYMATFNLEANTISGFRSKKGQPNITYIAIEDDDSTLINFKQSSYCVTERDGQISISVTSTGAFLGLINVNVSCFGGTATADVDFEAGIYDTSFSVDEEMSSLESFPIRINIVNDNVDEPDECFMCRITTVDGLPCAAIGNNTETQICIRKFCIPPVTINNETVVEGNTAKIRLELADTLSDNCSIKVQTMDETAVASRDYISREYTVEIPAGERIAYLMVETIDDDIAELTEFFTARITQTCEASIISEQQNTSYVTILDNDNITCSKAPENATVTEGEVAGLAVVCSGQTEFNFTLFLDTMDGSAVAPGDFTSRGYSLSFTAGQTSDMLSVQTLDDTVAECDEFFKVMITGSDRPDSVLIGDLDTCFVIIEDNNVLTVMFDPDDYEVSEGEIANVMLVTNIPYSFDFSVIVNCENGSAVAPGDFNAGEYTVNFSASLNVPRRSSFDVQTLSDNIFEGVESFKCDILRIMSDEKCSVLPGPQDMARVNITDSTVVCFDPKLYPVTEGDDVTLTLITNMTVAKKFSVMVTTLDGTARNLSDYLGGTRTAIFEIGSSTATVTYSTVDDNISEGQKYFTAQLSVSNEMQAMGVMVGEDCTARVDITDNETLFVMLETTACITPECDSLDGNATLEVALIASTTCEQKYTVIVTASDVTAKESKDYFGQSFNVTFLPLETRVPFNITIACDGIAELDEIFTLQLEAPQNMDGNCRDVQLGTLVRTNCTIEDEDTITCSKAPVNATVTEGEVAELTVNCSGKYEFDFTLFLDTMDGSAVAPGDYTSGGYSLSFTAGQTSGILSVQTLDDTVAECDEFFKVMITGSDRPDKVIIGDPDICYVNIENDDVQINFAEVQYTVPEGEERKLLLNITGCVAAKCLVDLKVSGGNAIRSMDFTSVPLQKEIPPSALDLDFPFKAICDNITEGLEYVELALEIPLQNDCRIEAIAPNTTRVNIPDSCVLQTSAIPVNDSVIADPLYTVPLCTMNTSNIIEGTPLCYEVHGIADHYFNLVSDDCTSVNAHYVAAVRPRAGNVIGQIGIVTSDSRNRCHRIQVDVTSDGQCQTQIDGDSISGATNTTAGVNVMAGRHYVRVRTRNCMEQDLVMWIRCHNETLNRTGDSFEQPMIKFVVTRGLETRSEAHGLIGQFWGVCINVTRYTGELLPSAQAHSGEYYTLHFNAINPNQRRTFTAKLGWTTWRLGYIPTLPGWECFYAGNSQGGRSIEATDPGVQDSVIEGNYIDYMASGLFDTQWHDDFSRFTAVCN